MEQFTPEAWLDLGIAGAAMLIVFFVVVFVFRQQAKITEQQTKAVERIGEKIDAMQAIVLENKNMISSILSNDDKNHSQTVEYVSAMQSALNELRERIVRIDTRLDDKLKKSSCGDKVYVDMSACEAVLPKNETPEPKT